MRVAAPHTTGSVVAMFKRKRPSVTRHSLLVGTGLGSGTGAGVG